MNIKSLVIYVTFLVCAVTLSPNKSEAKKQYLADAKSSIGLKIHMEGANANDTFSLRYYDNVLYSNVDRVIPHREQTFAANENGDVIFTFKNVADVGYISLLKKKTNLFNPINRKYTNKVNELIILDMYFVEAGDYITIKILQDSVYYKYINTPERPSLHLEDGYYNSIYQLPFHSLYFSGKGSAKYQCRYKADRFCSASLDLYPSPLEKKEFAPLSNFDARLTISLGVLEEFKSELTNTAAEVLKADFIGIHEKGRILSANQYRAVKAFKMDTADLIAVQNSYISLIGSRKINIAQDAQVISERYLGFIASTYWNGRFLSDSVIANGYRYYKSKYNGQVRDKLLTIYLIENLKWLKSGDTARSLLNDAIKTIQLAFCHKEIIKLLESESVGAKAYNFSLKDNKDRIVHLSDFLGKVVFVDFWYTGCSACSGYYKVALSKIEEEFGKDTNVVFITINVDTEKQEWLKSLESGKYTSTNIVNLNTGIAGRNHPIITKYRVVGYPRPLLIDKSGKIYSSSDTDLRWSETLRIKINEALNIIPAGSEGMPKNKNIKE